MNPLSRWSTVLATGITVMSGAGHGAAASVNVDMQGATNGGPGFNMNIGTYAGTAAAPSTGTTWNAFQFNNTLTPALLDDQGVATGVQMWLQGNPSEWSYSSSNALMGDYTFTNTNWSTNAGQRFTIFSNLANGGTGMQLDSAKIYDIYIYTLGDSPGQTATFQVNHSNGTTTKSSTGGGPFGGTFTEGENYLKFSNISPRAFNVSETDNGYEFEIYWGRAAGNTAAAAINGIQIVEVELPAAPVFTDQPDPYSGHVGDTFTLTAAAPADPAPAYQWQHSTDGNEPWTDLSGETNPSLLFSQATYSNNGFYRVIANNGTSAVSDTVQVSLTYPAPVIAIQPVSGAYYQGSEVILGVGATTYGTADFQWYEGTSGDTSNPIPDATGNTLLFPNIQPAEAGDYWVRITDTSATEAGLPATTTDSITATLQVLPPREGMVVLLDINSGNGSVASTDATPADFTAAGVPDLTAADTVGVSSPQPIVQVNFVSFSSGESLEISGSGAFGAWTVNNGSGLLNDYLFLQNGTAHAGPETLTLSNLNLEAGTSYTLYVFGKGENEGQDGVFTPVPGTQVSYQSTASSAGVLAVNFTTGAAYANDPLQVTWERGGTNTYAALNGFAIVPSSASVNNYAAWIALYPGVGSLTGFNDDADSDGIDNGMENFFGTDPGVASQGIVQVAKDGSTITFQHPQNSSPASDVAANYRWSTDLATFHSDGQSSGGTTVTFSPALNTPVAGTTTVTATISGTVPSKVFVSLGATINP